MTTPTQEDQSGEKKEKYDPFGERKSTTALDWAVLGCLVAGAVGIIKAFGMETPSGVLLCLLGSVAAFGLVIFAHLRK